MDKYWWFAWAGLPFLTALMAYGRSMGYLYKSKKDSRNDAYWAAIGAFVFICLPAAVLRIVGIL